MTPPPLTDRQQSVLDYIKATIDEYQYPPSVREIMAEFGFVSPNAAHAHLKALKQKDYIDWTPGLSRSIVVHGRRVRCPHCGRELKGG